MKTHEKPWEQSFGLRVFIKICEAVEVLGQNILVLVHSEFLVHLGSAAPLINAAFNLECSVSKTAGKDTLSTYGRQEQRQPYLREWFVELGVHHPLAFLVLEPDGIDAFLDDFGTIDSFVAVRAAFLMCTCQQGDT